MPLCLTVHQQTALDWLVTQIRDGASLVALRGLAGTGKTSMIPALRDALAVQGIATVVGSPTHRAAMILRQKGIDDADTVHAHALTPYFTADYRRASAWLGEGLPARLGEPVDVEHNDIEGMPWLLYEYTKPDVEKARNLKRLGARIPVKKRLASIGLHGKDFFAGFGPKQGSGVLVIDEASMVGRSMLTLCQEAYRQIVLIGDPGQLPPVKDAAVLLGVEGVELTEIHRQAADSPIIQLAYQARHGVPFWQSRCTAVGDVPHSAVVETAAADASALLESPLIVWRNVTRLQCTHAIRHALGLTKEALVAGEPLVCRSTAVEDRAEGFYNNGLYRIVAVHEARQVTVSDALGETSTITVHLEEVDGEAIPTNAIPFRFGYCLTAHTAQGGEWPTVYISMPDLKQYAGFCGKGDRTKDLAQWAYTAITRAKDTLCFLTKHVFERSSMPTKLAPPSAPMLTSQETHPVLEDIPDPVVPVEALENTAQEAPGSTIATGKGPDTSQEAPSKFNEHEALLHGFCQDVGRRMLETLRDGLQAVAATVMQEAVQEHHRNEDVFLGMVKKFVEAQQLETSHVSYALAKALTDLQAHGLGCLGAPYTATIHAATPGVGYPVTLTVAQHTPGHLIAALGTLFAGLQEAGMQAAQAQAPYGA